MSNESMSDEKKALIHNFGLEAVANRAGISEKYLRMCMNGTSEAATARAHLLAQQCNNFARQYGVDVEFLASDFNRGILESACVADDQDFAVCSIAFSEVRVIPAGELLSRFSYDRALIKALYTLNSKKSAFIKYEGYILKIAKDGGLNV